MYIITGKGWAHFLIGAVWHSRMCGWPDRCDPYVDVFIDNQKLNTSWIEDVGGYREFNEMLHSKLVPNDSTYTLKFMDKDPGTDDELATREQSIKDLMSPQADSKLESSDHVHILYYLGYWTDQYTDNNNQI